MGTTQRVQRFRANPIEITIFGIAALIFSNSVYSLLYDRESFQPNTLTPMHANPLREPNRSMASTASNSSGASLANSKLYSLDLSCDHTISKDLKANRVRLIGTYCEKDLLASKLLKTEIINRTNHYVATVFSDPENGRYSTDYIPLDSGLNGVRIEFSSTDGKSFVQELNLKRTGE